MFNSGPGELVALVLLVLAAFGARKLSTFGDLSRLREQQREPRPDLRLVRAHALESWSWRDWFRVCAFVALGVLAVLSIAMHRRAHG